MNSLFNWSLRVYLLLFVLVVGFTRFYRPDPSFYKNIVLQHSGDMVSKEWFPVSPLDLVWQSLAGITPILYITLPLVAFTLLLTTTATTKTTKVWKWIIGISLALIVFPIGLIFLLLTGQDTRGVPVGLALAPILSFGIPLLLVEIVGLLFSQWLARNRSTSFADKQAPIQLQPPL